MSGARKFANDVAVVVSTYNRPLALNLVLNALSKQTMLPAEIRIADDGSDSRTKKVIELWRDRGLQVKHHWHNDAGFRKTVITNQVIRELTLSYVIFLDGDCIPFPRFVEDHVLYRQAGCVLAGGRILSNRELSTEFEEGLRDFFTISLFGWLQLRLQRRITRWWPLVRFPDWSWRLRTPKNWRLLRGCNFSVDLASLKLVNGFDETIDGWGMEDSDLAVRLINLGLKIKNLRFAAPQLHLWHKEEDRSKLERNINFLNETIRSRRTRALKGLT